MVIRRKSTANICVLVLAEEEEETSVPGTVLVAVVVVVVWFFNLLIRKLYFLSILWVSRWMPMPPANLDLISCAESSRFR